MWGWVGFSDELIFSTADMTDSVTSNDARLGTVAVLQEGGGEVTRFAWAHLMTNTSIGDRSSRTPHRILITCAHGSLIT